MNELVKVENNKLAIPEKTSQELQINYSPARCLMKLRSITSIEKAVKSETPTLVSIEKQFSDVDVSILVFNFLDDLNSFFNIKTKMNEKQMVATAGLIVTKYYYLTIADLHLFFSNIKSGNYGTLYESLDGLKIMTWLSHYDTERAETCERMKPEQPKHSIEKVHEFYEKSMLAAHEQRKRKPPIVISEQTLENVKQFKEEQKQHKEKKSFSFKNIFNNANKT